MLEEWHDFYLLIGGAAGALIGLLFVVASLTSGMEEQTERGRQLFLSPVVCHFAVVLGVGGLAMVPHVPTVTAGVLVGAAALVGLADMVLVAREMLQGKTITIAHWSDPWWYGVVPAVIYASMLGAAVVMLLRPGAGLNLLAATVGALLALGIRNAWDLITWIAPRSTKSA